MGQAGVKIHERLTEPTNDFSLVLGGPLFQLLRRTHLTDDGMHLLKRRLIILPLLAWLPLLLLSVLQGHALTGTTVPFLYDVEIHVRFLVAMPLLIGAELYVHERLRLVLNNFLGRKLIPEQDMAKFNAAVQSAIRWRNSISAECILIAFVYAVGIFVVWRNFIGLDGEAWYATFQNGQRTLNLAGYWLVLFSLPFFQFLTVRWYYRMFIWARFLWKVSRINLSLIPTHPDRFGGLGFLTNSIYAFTLLAAAHGSLLAALIANRIFFAGATLPEFKLEIALLLGFLFMILVAPLFLFFLVSWPRPSAKASASMANWRSAMCVNTTRNGYAAARPSMKHSLATPTSSRWPI